jgi:hypothetical protein
MAVLAEAAAIVVLVTLLLRVTVPVGTVAAEAPVGMAEVIPIRY